MRILLVLNEAPEIFHSGASNSNRLLLLELAKRGHDVHTFGVGPGSASISVTLASERTKRTELKLLIGRWQPDAILCSCAGARTVLLEVALESRRPVVFLARETLSVGFGPHSAYQFPTLGALLPYCAALVGVSEYVAKYYREHTGVATVHVDISPMQDREWPNVGSACNPFVTMVNPCTIKGLPILLRLAAAKRHTRFAVVPSWGTTSADLERLREFPNVTILEPSPDIVSILRQTRVLLVPSLWQEGRCRMAVEAMLCGVPVLASHTGGLPEVLGQGTVPVNPIVRYERYSDERGVPVADVPVQPWPIWRTALEWCGTDCNAHRELAHEKYLPYRAAPFEAVLQGL